MSRKIIGVTVGTPLSIQTIKEKINPVISINGVEADENGNVEITIPDSGGNAEDGFSPVANVEQTATGAVISITDKSGITTATITNGKDGDDGTDGISPTVAVSKPGRVTTLTITDKNGTKTATINDGVDGKDGETGERGFGFLYYNGSNLDSDEDFINLNHLAAPVGYDPKIGDLMLCADGYVFEIVALSPDTGAEVRSTGICLIGKDGADGQPGQDGSPGKDGSAGKDGTSVTVSKVTESTADGGSNVVTFSDGKTLTVKNGSKGSTGGKGDTGATGQRGTGLLPVTTAPSGYTTAVGGITPKYRMAISTIKTQAGVAEVLLGDTVQYSYYHYPIDYLDGSYAYFENRVSIRGATGAAYTLTEDDKTAIAAAVKASLPTLTVTGIDADGVSHSWTVYGVTA
jgi:hypothetical protein